jgi:predicted dehydrogenase
MGPVNRRAFLRGTLGAATMATMLPQRPGRAASDKVIIGVMGLGGRGTALAKMFAGREDVEIAYLCDPDSRRLPQASQAITQAQGKQPQTVQDFRRILDDKNVDALIIATPDHWHALGTILACQAGKDVYVEKPMAHNVWEGRKMIEAARKYKRVVQVGMQTRSSPYAKDAAEQVRGGKLGDVYLIRVFNMMQHPAMKEGSVQPVPQGFDYDLWCGPAPKLPYNPSRYWLNQWEYSCGPIPGDAIHQLDLARTLFGDKPYPDAVAHTGGVRALRDGREIPDTQFALFDYGDLTLDAVYEEDSDEHPRRRPVPRLAVLCHEDRDPGDQRHDVPGSARRRMANLRRRRQSRGLPLRPARRQMAPGQLHSVHPHAGQTKRGRRAGSLLRPAVPHGQHLLSYRQPEARLRSEDGNLPRRPRRQQVPQAHLPRTLGRPRPGLRPIRLARGQMIRGGTTILSS